MKKYYVYSHYNEKYGTFYVGKGSNERLFNTKNRSFFWNRIVKKYGFTASIIEECENEKTAFEREIFWIAYFKKNGQCVANFTLGGEGVNVEKRWWNDKISKSLKGIKRPCGKENKSYKDFADEDLLRRLYVNYGLSSVKISELLGVSCTTVCARLLSYGIKTKPKGKIIICVDDGIEHESIKSAARHYGLYRENIRKVLSGKYKTTGNLKFIYKE